MLHVNMIEAGVGPPQLEKHTLPKWVYRKYENLEHKYKATKAQLPRKANGAQFSIERRPILPKYIGS